MCSKICLLREKCYKIANIRIEFRHGKILLCGSESFKRRSGSIVVSRSEPFARETVNERK